MSSLPGAISRSTVVGALCGRVMTDDSAFAELRPIWDELLNRSPESTPWQSWEYIFRWWQMLREDRQLRIVLVERDGQPCLLLPLQLSTTRELGLPFSWLEPIGMPDDINRPRLALGTLDSDAYMCGLEALYARRHEWQGLRIDERDEDDAELQYLREFCGQKELRLHRVTLHPCPQLDLQQQWNKYLSSRGTRLRKNLRAARRRLETRGPVALRVYRSVAEIAAGYDEVLRIHARSWKSKEAIGLCRSADYQRFYREYLLELAAADRTRILILFCGEVPVAGTIAITDTQTYYSVHIAHDESYADASPGTLLESMEIEGLMHAGRLRRYDFLGAALNNKLRWTGDIRPTCRAVVLQAQGRAAWVERYYFQAKPALRRLRSSVSRLSSSRRIPLDPILDWRKPIAPADVDLHEVLGMPPGDTVFTAYSGTSALYQCLRRLKIGAGDRVLIPAYNCGHEIEAVLRCHASPAYFRVDRNLQIDEEHLEELLRMRTTAVIVTHYLGLVALQIARIRALCDAHGALLIEDCAHALFSAAPTGPAGTMGDAAIFSPRKTLPLICGGIGVLRADHETTAPVLLAPPPRLTRWSHQMLLKSKAYRQRAAEARAGASLDALRALLARSAHFTLKIACRASIRTQHDPEKENFDFPQDVLAWDIDPLSEQWLRTADGVRIRERRRQNFALLHRWFCREQPACVVLRDLRPGECPLYYVYASEDRDSHIEQLRAAAVPALDWWDSAHSAVPWDEFQEELQLKRCLIALPVHQDLANDQIETMIEAVSRVLRA